MEPRPCPLCEGPMKPYIVKRKPTDIFGCAHCDRGCPRPPRDCRRCQRVNSTTPDKAA